MEINYQANFINKVTVTSYELKNIYNYGTNKSTYILTVYFYFDDNKMNNRSADNTIDYLPTTITEDLIQSTVSKYMNRNGYGFSVVEGENKND